MTAQRVGAHPTQRREPASSRPRRRPSRSVVLRVVRALVVIAAVVLVVVYLVLPQLSGASKDIHRLRDVQPVWGIAGLALEAASLLSYAQLTRTLLAPPRPRLGRLFRITLATTGVSHSLPAGGVTGQGLAVQLLTAEGVPATDAGFVVVAEAMYSAVVLNALLWFALLASIPLAGVRPLYLVVAIVGL